MTDRDIINSIIDAWEALPGGRRYGLDEIQNWLVEDMSPVIRDARKAIGRKSPHRE